MRFISTRVHGMMDYLMGVLLIISPYLFGFAAGGPKQWLPIVLGLTLLMQSMLTRYELGLMPVIAMPFHLGLDIASGLLLAASPWLFGFADQVFWPHVILGLIEIGTALLHRDSIHREVPRRHGQIVRPRHEVLRRIKRRVRRAQP